VLARTASAPAPLPAAVEKCSKHVAPKAGYDSLRNQQESSAPAVPTSQDQESRTFVNEY